MQYFILSLLVLISQPSVAETLDLFPHSNKTELRDISLGMHVKDIPANHFKNFICVNDNKELNSLSNFEECTTDKNGMHEVGLKFDTTGNEWAKANDNLAETTIAGHPVILSLLIDMKGLLQGIKAFTNPGAPGYTKRQSYLLSRRIQSHYGSDKWECIDKKPGAAGNKPIGRVYIDQHCIKTFNDKKITVESKLYRGPNQTGKEFTNLSAIEMINLPSSNN
jgi:hypothetical protein